MCSFVEQWLANDSYFDDLAVFGLGTLHPGGLQATKELLTYLDWNEKTVLDVGCGNGTTMKLLLSIGASPVGIESSSVMRQAALQNGIEESRLIAGDIETVNLRPHEFDIVVIEGVLGFLSNPTCVISKLSQTLKSEGHMLIFDWVPHQRKNKGNSEYGFTVFGKTHPQYLMRLLTSLRYKCELHVEPAVAHKFHIKRDEAIRRSRLFFRNVDEHRLEMAVARKVDLMSSVLDEEISCERFFLAGYRKSKHIP